VAGRDRETRGRLGGGSGSWEPTHVSGYQYGLYLNTSLESEVQINSVFTNNEKRDMRLFLFLYLILLFISFYSKALIML